MASIEDLTTPLAAEEIKASIYRVLERVGVATTNWKPGAVVRTIIAACAIVLAALSKLVALIAKSGFLDTAEKNWLTQLAWYVYGVERFTATFASGTIRIDNTAGFVYEFDPGELLASSSVTGKLYVNVNKVVIGALQTGILAEFRAVEAGEASTAQIGEIDTLATALSGVEVSNVTVFVGLDDEEDEELRIRCRARLGALSPNGPKDAYEFLARNATREDGTRIGVTRTRVRKDGFGRVFLSVATGTGGVSGAADDPATDLGAIAQEIYKQAEPLCVTAVVSSATPSPISITYTAYVYNTRGLAAADAVAAINAELTRELSEKPIGGDSQNGEPGFVYASWIRGVVARARTSDGAMVGVFRSDVSLPAGDIPLLSTEAPVAGILTGTVVLVNP